MKIIYLFITWWKHVLDEFLGKIYFFCVKKLFKKCGNKILFIGIPFITGINKIELGNNINFGQKLYIRGEGGLIIEDNCFFASNVTIYTFNHNYQGELLPFDYKDIPDKVIIKKNVWVGRNVSILPGVTIGEGAIIGMGSVVVKDIPPCAIAMGNPAVVIGFRDIEKYKALEKEKKYFQIRSIFYYIKKIFSGFK